MDLYKVFDQTVREIKREVNKKVLKVPEIEQKVLEATSNEPWGPHGSLMSDIAQATRNYHEYQMIMAILWKRLNDTGKNWRHVYKALTVLEFLVAQGADRTIDELKEHTYQIQTLVDFQFVEPNGKDQGINVRKKAQTIVALINDKEKIREARAKAAANRDKYKGMSSTGGKSSSYGGGDRYGDDSDKYGGGSRYGDRDRDSDRYGKDGDRYGGSREGDRDSDRYGGRGDIDDGDRYGRDDRDRYDDDRYGSKGGRDYDDDYDPRRSDRSVTKNRPPPSYEESYSDSGYQQGEDEPRDGSVAAAVARSKGTPKGAGSQGAAGPGKGNFFAAQAADDEFDDFDPRGRPAAPAAAAGAVHPEDDFFNQAAPKPAGGVEDLFGDAAFQAAPPAPKAADGDLFGSGGFQAAPAPPAAVGLAPPPAYTAPMSGPPSNGGMDGGFGQFESAPAPPAPATHGSGFGFDAFGGEGFSAFEAAKPASVASSGPLSTPLPATSSNTFQAMSTPVVSGPASTGSNAGMKIQEFQPKSTIFADTLSTGLVDLNIKGPRDNPLASLGIDLTDTTLARAQQAKAEQSPPNSITMGKAMGSGTGMGVAGASGLAAPPHMMVPPMGGGMGMGMGGGMGMGMNPGMGMGMNPGMGMGMNPGMGMGMNPGMGMGGMGMNPGMGMGPGFAPMGMGPQYPQGQFNGGGFR